MYKAVFQNSKIALAFALLTIMSAVSMVGTADDAGVLVKAGELASAARDKVGRDQSPIPAESGNAQTPKTASVFGEYDSQAENANGSGGSQYSGNPASAPLSPNAVKLPPGP